MKTDIRNRKDIEKLIDVFYEEIRSDQVIGYFFTDVAKVNWEVHLPKMYNFWDNILFQSGNFNGSPMTVHKELHHQSTMTQDHFLHWNKLFIQTVDKLFHGEKANEIKSRASNISAIMMYKVLS